MNRRTFMKMAGVFGLSLPGKRVLGEQTFNNTSPASIEWSRRVPVRYEADVAIIGGGIAGVCAAMAAAKSGAKVILIERFAVTGGNATVGGVASFCGETAGQGEAFDAIIAAMTEWNAIEPYQPYTKASNRKFNHEILAVVLQELLLKRGIKLLLHTQFVDVRAEHGRIREAIICGSSGPEAVRASVFVDCTGEADMVRRAGLATVKGRAGDGLTLPMSLMYFVRHVEQKDARVELPEGWFSPVRDEKDLPMTSVWPDGPRSNAIKIKIPMYDAGDTESLTAAEIRGRRRMMEVLSYQQKVEKKLWRLDHCSGRIGIREGRRILGSYVLTVEDLRAGRSFDDAIARGVFYLDGHKPDDDKRTYILSEAEMKVPPYQIPLRCLMPREGRNVLAAGRCMSADQLALSSARVMTTCAMMGQAAGIAAALAAEQNMDTAALDGLKVRKVVEERGAVLKV